MVLFEFFSHWAVCLSCLFDKKITNWMSKKRLCQLSSQSERKSLEKLIAVKSDFSEEKSDCCQSSVYYFSWQTEVLNRRKIVQQSDIIQLILCSFMLVDIWLARWIGETLWTSQRESIYQSNISHPRKPSPCFNEISQWNGPLFKFKIVATSVFQTLHNFTMQLGEVDCWLGVMVNLCCMASKDFDHHRCPSLIFSLHAHIALLNI